MQNNLISIGYLDGAAHLLSQIESNSVTKLSELYDLAFADNIRLRGTWEIVVNKSIENEWIIVGFDDEIWLGQGLNEQLKSGDSKSLKRQLLWLYIQKQKPAWVRFVSTGISSAKQHITDDDERQAFREAGLFPDSKNNSLEISKWWIKVQNLARSIVQDRHSETGVSGEFLTIEYELKRTGVRPTHVAFETNEYGFDVLSQKNSTDDSPIFIEVKSSTSSYQNAHMFLSRFEYEKSLEYGEDYFFHLWDMSGEPNLLIVPSDEINQHVPVDSGEGVWQSVKIGFDRFNWTDRIEFSR